MPRLAPLAEGLSHLQNRSKWKASSRKLNDARNEYLLALASANSIQQTYYKGATPAVQNSKISVRVRSFISWHIRGGPAVDAGKTPPRLLV